MDCQAKVDCSAGRIAGVLLYAVATLLLSNEWVSKPAVYAQQNSASDSSSAGNATESPLLKYRILNKEVYDVPIKTQIMLEVLASENVTKEGVRVLLKDLCRQCLSERGFKYHGGRPTHVFIYVYPTKEHQASGTGLWLGMLSKAGANDEPRVDINEDFIEKLDDPPVMKFGYSEVERKSVFRLLVDVERKADEEAEGEYPLEPEKHLKVGSHIVLAKRTPLMPEMEPEDPMEALAKVKEISAGVSVEVVAVSKDKHGTRCYGVRLMGGDESEIASGWINSIALIGQMKFDRKVQLKQQSSLFEHLKKQYEDALGRELGLTEEQFDEISSEGLDKYWPFYPPPKLVSPYRVWTDDTGKYRQEAKYVSNDRRAVKLRHRDGREVEVPLERLSESDRKWIEAQAKVD